MQKDYFKKYTIITKTASISIDEYIRDYRNEDLFMSYCKACRSYNCCWACPPYDFDVLLMIKKYKNANIISTQIFPDNSLRDLYNTAKQNIALGKEILAEARKKIDEELLLLEKKHSGSRAFFAGNCFSCPIEKCARIEGKPCVRPEQIRYSLESFGFDIEKTASDLLGITLKWSSDGQLPEYFTLISGIFLK